QYIRGGFNVCGYVATEENLHNLYEPVPNKGTNEEALKRITLGCKKGEKV
ncbi:hypothetical protein D0Y65_001947, partial [Glycine soja]